jgi:DNA repair exonuclease SbcCD ATPase subunit
MAAQIPVCLYNKYGYCKHKEMCRKRHVNQICETIPCEVYTFRHPKICKFFWNYGQCKFDPCAYLHKDNDNSFWKLKQENEILQEKINNIDQALNNLNDQEHETWSTIDKINEVKSNLDDKEQKIDSLQKLVHATNANLEKLKLEIERKFQCFEESFVILKKCVSKKDALIEALENKLNEKTDCNATKVKCSTCNFEGISKQCLKVHMARKHTLQVDNKSRNEKAFKIPLLQEGWI